MPPDGYLTRAERKRMDGHFWAMALAEDRAKLLAHADAMEALVRELAAELRKMPCSRADFEGDTCDFWAEAYGHERCLRCAALVAIPPDLRTAWDGTEK